MRLISLTRVCGTITTRSSMDFDKYFDGNYATNEEENKLVEGFSYETTLQLVKALSKSDRLKLSLYLLENSVEDLSEEQWQSLIFYLKRRKGIKSEDLIEQQRLEDTFSRVILSTDYGDYTPREWIVDYLNVYFDWSADELDVLHPTTVFFTNIWNDFVKHVAYNTGWNELKVKRKVKQDYFKKYLMNYGSYGKILINKNEELYRDWLSRATILARRDDISKKSAKKLLFERDPEDYKRANAKTIRVVIKDLPSLKKEWQVLTPNFVYSKNKIF